MDETVNDASHEHVNGAADGRVNDDADGRVTVRCIVVDEERTVVDDDHGVARR
jgi:hypothetical protein